LHRLKDKRVARDVLVNEIEREKRVAQVIENTEEKHDVEALFQRADVVDRELAKFYLRSLYFRGEARLREIFIVPIDAEDSLGTTGLHRKRVESRIAADVQNRKTGEIGRDSLTETAPFDAGIISEKVSRRGRHAHEVEVVKPWTQRCHAVA